MLSSVGRQSSPQCSYQKCVIGVYFLHRPGDAGLVLETPHGSRFQTPCHVETYTDEDCITKYISHVIMAVLYDLHSLYSLPPDDNGVFYLDGPLGGSTRAFRELLYKKPSDMVAVTRAEDTARTLCAKNESNVICGLFIPVVKNYSAMRYPEMPHRFSVFYDDSMGVYDDSRFGAIRSIVPLLADICVYAVTSCVDRYERPTSFITGRGREKIGVLLAAEFNRQGFDTRLILSWFYRQRSRSHAANMVTMYFLLFRQSKAPRKRHRDEDDTLDRRADDDGHPGFVDIVVENEGFPSCTYADAYRVVRPYIEQRIAAEKKKTKR